MSAAAAAWTTNSSSLVIKCQGESFDVSNLTGNALAAEIKKIARSAGISKFDLYDQDGNVVEPEEVMSGDFKGSVLTVTRYNVAA